ncbi:hypothetical protein LMH87_006612 [Akanthomyces muscarius]|uniref:Fe2OG dioxygenase domain-containing protein n=1 Tax=Akanthomyces muscarius TaxID=2231603 RepID=A0A9W8QPX8_AKAMU|nr:hypothetical protein LMH87_006612 [Akanthomyces muscarius]KAJ4164960.1 hypothetical protein LMH87_006612 [Akanthomyces muscarius]
MASEELFKDVPPFPNDISTVQMSTISLSRLRENDAATAQQASTACAELGFFFLDLRGDSLGEAMVECIDELFYIGKDIFDLPESVKNQYLHDIPKSFLGFKPRGAAKTETKQPDRFEWFNLGQDGLMGTTDLQPLPDFVLKRIDYFKRHLSLPQDTFSALQRPTEPSGTAIRLIKTFASPDDEDLRTSMAHHTDFGTITLLANIVGGLQILKRGGSASDEGAWRWVRPQPGCLIVNLGDAMVQWSGGALRSNMHRIRYAPGEQRAVDRYSLAMLFRPEQNASMKPRVTRSAEGVEDTDLTAWEWEVKRMMAYSRGEAQAESKGGTAIKA